MTPIKIGSEAHKELLCRFFIETHDPYKPAELAWPDLDEAARRRLAALPIWNEAVSTEAETALKVVTLGKAEKDPLMAEAISLQGYEEERHAEILRLLTKNYGIPIDARVPTEPEDPEWHFLRVGYGECFDSFFAFGLFALANESGFFPPSLVTLFEPIMQEEARHILFHVNWIEFKRARRPLHLRPAWLFQRGLAVALQVACRIRTAIQVGTATAADGDQDNFAMTAASSFGDVTAKEFIELCIRENDRRLAPYDPRLLRPLMVPRVARTVLSLLPKGQPQPAAA